MTYDKINSILLCKLVDMHHFSKEYIQQELEFWSVEAIDEIPCYCLMETMVGNYMKWIMVENVNVAQIQLLFDTFEEMAVCDDINVRDLLQVGFLEQLYSSKDLLTTAYKYMHPQTEVLCRELKEYFNEPV